MQASDLSDEGVLVGTASYQGQDAQGNPQGSAQVHGILLVPALLTVTNVGTIQGNQPKWDDNTINGVNYKGLNGPCFHPKATFTNLPGVNIKATIYQDIQMQSSIIYDDGSSSRYAPDTSLDYLPDNNPSSDNSVRSEPNADGTTTLYFNPNIHLPDGYGDDPAISLRIASPQRQHLKAASANVKDVKDFLAVSINGGPEQIVAEVHWSNGMVAYFKPDPDGDRPTLDPVTPPFTPVPNLNVTVYGVSPSNSDKPISDRTKQADDYLNDPNNWKVTGKQGSIADTYPSP